MSAAADASPADADTALPPETYDEATGQTTFAVRVAPGEFVKYSVVVDAETGLDVCPHSGRLQPREETVANVKEVYAVGKEALGADLERYNKWLAQNPDKEKKLFGSTAAAAAAPTPSSGKPSPAAPRAAPAPRDSARGGIEDLTAKAENLKSQGNVALQRGDLRGAVKRYTEGIAADAGVVALWANRAEAYLRLKRFAEALADAEHAIAATAGPHEKALFRKVAALKGMRRFRDALAAAELGEAAFGGDVWASARRDVAASPSLLLDAVVDTQDLSAGSAGFCAVAAAERVANESSPRRGHLGTLPVCAAWRPKVLRAACRELCAIAAGSDGAGDCAVSSADGFAHVVPALALQLVREAGAAPTSVSPLPTAEMLEQHAGLLGPTVEVGTSDVHFAAVERAMALSRHVLDVSSSFVAECEAAGLTGAAVAALRDRFAPDGAEALAPTFLSAFALQPASRLLSAEGDVEGFVAQGAFFDPRRNPGLAHVTSASRVAARLELEPAGAGAPESGNAGALLHPGEWRMAVTAVDGDADAAVGMWVVDAAAAQQRTDASVAETPQHFDWYAA